jgi:hypothetical protein
MCGKALVHDGVILVEQDVFQIDFWTGIGNPAAHSDPLLFADSLWR